MLSVYRVLPQEGKSMFGKIHIQYVGIVRSKKQLLIRLDMVNHKRKHGLFNITVDVRELFIAVVKGIEALQKSRDNPGYLHAGLGAAGKQARIQSASVLKDD